MNKRKMILIFICINLFVVVLAGLKIGNEKYRWLREETHSLSPNENELSYYIWPNHGTDMLCAIVDCGDVEKEETYLKIPLDYYPDYQCVDVAGCRVLLVFQD